METIPFNRKLTDTGNPAEFGRQEQFWAGEVLKDVFKGKRLAKEISNSFRFYDPEHLLEHFGLKGIEFGQWLSQEARYIYLAGAAYGMRDFCEILDIEPKRFGLKNRITLALGARGHSRAVAHFEPSTFAINITRHSKRELSPVYKYFHSGAGSLGHEYAHALDFYAGQYIDTKGNFNFLSDSLKEIFAYSYYQNEQRFYVYNPLKKTDAHFELKQAIVDSLGALLFKPTRDKNGAGKEIYTETFFYSNLKAEIAKNEGMGDYWLEIIEIFARSYEVFLFKKCNEAGIEESFLKKTKYEVFLYPSAKLFTKEIERAFAKFTRLTIQAANK